MIYIVISTKAGMTEVWIITRQLISLQNEETFPSISSFPLPFIAFASSLHQLFKIVWGKRLPEGFLVKAERLVLSCLETRSKALLGSLSRIIRMVLISYIQKEDQQSHCNPHLSLSQIGILRPLPRLWATRAIGFS